MSLPAHHTKHISLLNHSFPPSSSTFFLSQLDDGNANGTALWLGAQCLSFYLADTNPGRVIELGSGVGLTALALSSLGWEVLATDISPVISTVLAKNIRSNLSPSFGPIQVRELDWTVPPQDWIWDDNSTVSSQSGTSSPSHCVNLLNPPYDLICAADTVYIPSLVEPLLRTIHALCKLSVAASPRSRSPTVYICIERRDTALVDRLLSEAKTTWGFLVVRIPHRRLAKAMEKGRVTWAKEEWEGIEIWKLTLPRE